MDRLDVSEHLRGEYIAAAGAARADKRRSDAALRASEAALRDEGSKLRKLSKQMSRARGFRRHAASPSLDQSVHSLQGDIELETMRNKLLENRLALAGPMFQRQHKDLASLIKQVCSWCRDVVVLLSSFLFCQMYSSQKICEVCQIHDDNYQVQC